jgi:LuxR family transcriptional regulator, maltose regulon positive regulatory protein
MLKQLLREAQRRTADRGPGPRASAGYVAKLLAAMGHGPPASGNGDPGASGAFAGLLSEREKEVLALLALGVSNQEIAARLFVSLDTVKSHLKHLYGKLDVHSRTQAVARAKEMGLL